MLLFKIFDCRFLAFIDWLFRHAFSRLSLLSAQRLCAVGSEVVFLMSKILTCFFLFQVIQRCDMLYLDCYWIPCELAKISMVEKLISKELVNPYGLYDNSLLMGAPPHMAILPG